MSNYKSIKLSKYYGLLAGGDRPVNFLSKEEELGLFRLIQLYDYKKARDRVVEAHVPLVFKVASGYKGGDKSMRDLTQDATLGLMTAVDKFDVYEGVRFATYASWWIRAEIKENLVKNSNVVKYATTSKKRTLFFKLSQLEEKFYREDPGMTSRELCESIAKELDMSPEYVEEVQLLKSGAPSLNVPMKSEGEESDQFQDFVPADEMNPEEIICTMDENSYRNDILENAIEKAGLSERDKVIFKSRRLLEKPRTLGDLSEQFGISNERVRQLEVRAFDKIQIAALGLISGDEIAAQEKRQERVLVNG